MSGKSYFAEQLSNRFHTIYFDFSDLTKKYDIQSEDIQQFLMYSALKNKRNVVIEGCLDTEQDRSNIRTACREAGYLPVLVWVQTDMGTIQKRSAKTKTTRKSLEKDYKGLEVPSARERHITISGKFSFEIQCRVLLKALSKYLKRNDPRR